MMGWNCERSKKMAVFDKTEPLVMMPPCSAFTTADKTDALAADNIAKMSLQQWVGTNVALYCYHMNMPLAGRAKFANCNAHEDKKVISKQLLKLCVPKLRRKRKLLTPHDVKELLKPNADAAHDKDELPDKKELRREGVASRFLPTISSGGV